MGRKTNRERINSFKQFLNEGVGNAYIKETFAEYNGKRMEIFKPWYQETGSDGEVFPRRVC